MEKLIEQRERHHQENYNQREAFIFITKKFKRLNRKEKKILYLKRKYM